MYICDFLHWGRPILLITKPTHMGPGRSLVFGSPERQVLLTLIGIFTQSLSYLSVSRTSLLDYLISLPPLARKEQEFWALSKRGKTARMK